MTDASHGAPCSLPSALPHVGPRWNKSPPPSMGHRSELRSMPPLARSGPSKLPVVHSRRSRHPPHPVGVLPSEGCSPAAPYPWRRGAGASLHDHVERTERRGLAPSASRDLPCEHFPSTQSRPRAGRECLKVSKGKGEGRGAKKAEGDGESCCLGGDLGDFTPPIMEQWPRQGCWRFIGSW